MKKPVIALVLLLLAGIGGYLARHKIKALLFSPAPRTENTVEKRLLFRIDPTLDELADALQQEGIISDKSHFLSYVQENKLPKENFAAGKYMILSGTLLDDLVSGFVKGDNGQGKAEVKVNVVFNNCEVVEDIGSNISRCILADSASIVDCILSRETLSTYNFTAEQIPALFIPKTYEMYFDTNAEEFVAFMAERFKEFWTDERKAKLKAVGLERESQAATLASIVFMEQSRHQEEWPIIAKLYLNRLQKGMKLEADPTFKFCWPDRLNGIEHLLHVHRDKDCPYNTYLYNGIPPGPVCIPPADAIDAVLNPADVDYIFLCGDGTGRHNFAATNAEHERNVAAYRKWLREYEQSKEG